MLLRELQEQDVEKLPSLERLQAKQSSRFAAYGGNITLIWFLKELIISWLITPKTDRHWEPINLSKIHYSLYDIGKITLIVL